MASLVERLLILIDAQSGGAVREFRKVAKGADDLGKQTGLTGKALNALGLQGQVSGQALKSSIGVAAGAGIYALGQLGQAALNNQRDLKEQVSATGVIFGNNAAQMEQWAGRGATAFGLSKRAALESANGFGALFNTLEQGPEITAKFAQGFSQLASDLASFRNTNVEDAAQALRSGLVGENEPLKRYNIVLNETLVRNKALELGLADSTGAISEQAKVFARAQLIIEKSSFAQGDFARTSGGLANQQRILSAQMENLSANAGTLLIPAVTKATTGLNKLAEGAVKVSQSKVGKGLADGIVNAIPGIGQVNQVLSIFGGKTKEAKQETVAFTSSAQKASAAQSIYAQLLYSGTASTGALAAAQRGLAAAGAKAAADQRTLTNAMRPMADKAKDLQSALLGTLNAQRSLASATRSVRDSQERLGDARQRLNDLLSKAAIDTKRVADAERSLEDASRGVADAQRQVAEAQANLDKVRRGTSQRDLASAELDVRSAVLAREQAERRLSQATQKVVDAQVSRDPWAYADAVLDQQQAELELVRATEGITDAQERLNQLQNVGKEGSDSLSDAQRRLEDAQRSAEQASRSQADAQEQLNEAQRADPSLSGQIQQAKRDLRDAEQGVSDAKWGVFTAAISLTDAQRAERDAFYESGDAVSYLYYRLSGLIGLYPELAPLIGALGGHMFAPTPLGANFAGGYASAGSLGSRASGGSVQAGTTYRINEQGEEFFTPNSSGHVTPAGGMGGSTTITINMPPGSDGDDVVNAIRRYEQRNGSGWRR